MTSAESAKKNTGADVVVDGVTQACTFVIVRLLDAEHLAHAANDEDAACRVRLKGELVRPLCSGLSSVARPVISRV